MSGAQNASKAIRPELADPLFSGGMMLCEKYGRERPDKQSGA
jgi:hypothetical protein